VAQQHSPLSQRSPTHHLSLTLSCKRPFLAVAAQAPGHSYIPSEIFSGFEGPKTAISLSKYSGFEAIFLKSLSNIVDFRLLGRFFSEFVSLYCLQLGLLGALESAKLCHNVQAHHQSQPHTCFIINQLCKLLCFPHSTIPYTLYYHMNRM
jgi:hypothetical protein